MRFKRRIHRRNLPVDFPVNGTLLAFLALKVFEAPQWMWWVTGVYFFIEWIITLIFVIKTKEEDVFKEN